MSLIFSDQVLLGEGSYDEDISVRRSMFATAIIRYPVLGFVLGLPDTSHIPKAISFLNQSIKQMGRRSLESLNFNTALGMEYDLAASSAQRWLNYTVFTRELYN
ncbi:Uu.00g103930.m01.CDS01 [Anthostomella pinea]|uniref:Uu.00g103930.m01.CDS01 n=1 Tax=Anthostomella pinea TaxID=933095 RepID=A0AAI8YFN4_9PEZI|nr:Uu.00g103930.m01.CDS01 [Anthostomella pinea]